MVRAATLALALLASSVVHAQTSLDFTTYGEVFANRLQDWRTTPTEARCVEASPNFPLRTLMRLDHELVHTVGVWTTRVTTRGPRAEGEAGVPTTDDALRGVLFGAGGPHVDHRLSAMVHHRPAEDGGLFAAVDAHGSVALFDMGADARAGGSWSVGGPLKDGELPLLAHTVASRAPAGEEIVLEVVVYIAPAGFVHPERENALVSLMARDERGAVLSQLVKDVPVASVDGLFGLVSHRGEHVFSDWSADGGGLMRTHDGRGFGPIVTTHFTLDEDRLRLTAQLLPLRDADVGSLRLEVDGAVVATAPVDVDAWTATFDVAGWDTSRRVEYSVALDVHDADGATRTVDFAGSTPPEPADDLPFVVASMNCQKIYTGELRWNHDGVWFPHAETARHVGLHEPDLLFFAGDQIYEGDLDPVDARDEDTLILDYLYKWYRHCWSFRELTRRVPSVVIPDDHDVYHGNLWGAGGVAAVADPERGLSAQDAGGYKHGPRFVNVVHRTQTSHLPTSSDPAPVARGISVYFTDITWGGVGLAVLADRQWKSSASVMVPDGRVVNGWFQDEDFDPRDADVDGAVLLGERQEAFLARWAEEDDGTWARLALSQTPFVNIATLPAEAKSGGVLPSLEVPAPGERPDGQRLAADTDSGGWPQSGRDRAVDLLRRAGAIHLAGDQHLGSLVQYGLDAHRDAGLAFTAPAVANTWPRRWWPPVDGENRDAGAPAHTGDFVDGFGNKMTVWAVANPVASGREPARLYDRTPGYGIVVLDPTARTVTFGCWPRWEIPIEPDAAQYPGWPRTFPLPARR